MKIIEQRKSFIEGVYEIIPLIHQDERGTFTKVFHSHTFEQIGLNTHWPEQYYSKSKKDVIRGMHFQLPPYDHDKLVSCVEGEILDVVLDLRKYSKTFGQLDSFELTSTIGNSLYIPKGCAHGFYTRSSTALVLYNVSTVFEPTADFGVKWDSFGMEWPNKQPIVSTKDRELPNFRDFDTPFID